MKLDLCIPGLLAAPPRLASQLELPQAAALRTFVERAQIRETAFGRYGYISAALQAQQLPLAALSWFGATGEQREGLLFATPVHLQAGMNDLVLFAGPALQVSREECERLARDIAAFFGDEPKLVSADGQMFVHAPQLDVHTTPLHEAQGATVRANLPRGADASRVHAWMNELQMFLHGHAVNSERAAAGLPSLNGVWLAGEGELPPARPQGLVVFARSLAMRGLGRLLGEVREPGAVNAMLPASGRHVIEIPSCLDALDADDVDGWRAAVEKVSREILQPVLEWTARHRDAEAVLYAGDGRMRTVRGGNGWLRRVFRRGSVLRVTEE